MSAQPSLTKGIPRDDQAGANAPRGADGRRTIPAFNNLKTRTKLTAAFLAVALIIVGVAAVGYVSVKSVNAGMKTLYADRLLPTQQLGNVNDAQLKIQGDIYQCILAPKDQGKLEQDIAAHIKIADHNLKEYEATYLVPDEVRGLAEFRPVWASYLREVEDCLRQIKAGDPKAALQSVGEAGALFTAKRAVEQILDELLAVQVRVGVDLKREGDRTFNQAVTIMAAAAIIGVFLAIVLGILMGRSITIPLARITGVATEMAGGKLDTSALDRITSRDEIGVLARTLAQMANQLKLTLAGLRRSRDELETRVQERTGELRRSNEQLELEIAERKRAEAVLTLRSQELARSNAELGMFAYVASHDLQEPLRMVASYLQLVDKRYREKLDADGREFIEFAVDGAKRMQRLINDLLAYSRIGTQGQGFKPTDCEAVLQTTIRNLQVGIRESGAQITHDPLPTVIGDATQLVQLFQNLIGNALKFRREEPPQIQIRAESKGDFWWLSVQDNGIGIEAQYFDRIFVVFQRLHGRGKYPGTGIGLAICKKIVERHGGTIWVESEFGKGSTFHFMLAATSRGNDVHPGPPTGPARPDNEVQIVKPESDLDPEGTPRKETP
jgi:signal transduction histidine kinase